MVQMFITNLIMDIHHLQALLEETISIPAAYMLLRNILENFVKLCMYIKLCEQKIPKSLDPNLVLGALFLYDHEAEVESYKTSKRKFEKTIIKCLRKVEINGTSISTLINEIKEKKLPKLRVQKTHS